jgi:Holliday junction DNA helicase RuvA
VIALLQGRVAEKAADRVVLDVGGVGYEVQVPVSTASRMPAVGVEARLFTRMHVRDDAMLLFGFASADERSLFDLLITVNGVGPKVALAFLSALAPASLRRAVVSGDVAALTVVPGVGKKVAQRVVLDLKDKLGGDVVVLEGPLVDVREALLALGLSPQEVSDAIGSLEPDGERPVEELLREALQRVGGGSDDGARSASGGPRRTRG